MRINFFKTCRREFSTTTNLLKQTKYMNALENPFAADQRKHSFLNPTSAQQMESRF
jgi:hypothetical protein